MQIQKKCRVARPKLAGVVQPGDAAHAQLSSRKVTGGTTTKKVLYRDALLVSTNAFLLLVELSFEVCVSRAHGFLVFREKKIRLIFSFIV